MEKNINQIKTYKLVHILTGKVGVFVKQFRNYYGEAIMIRLDNGREYYAPKHEFKEIHSY